MLLLLSSLDKRLDKYVLGEKRYLANYFLNAGQKKLVLDLEVAFARKKDSEEKVKRDYIADRIDMAWIVKENNKAILRLIEVKVDTDPRLRSSIDGGQEVLKQMKHYSDFLNDQEQNIQKSYRKIADNYLELNLLNKFSHVDEAADMLKLFKKSGVVDLTPYLLIIKTKENIKGKYDNHAQLLNDELQKNSYNIPIFWDAV